jgi:hypothetical protein
VPGRYDEWAAARSAALRHFAHALADGDGRSADRAVHRALRKVEGQWDRVVARDHPDLVARAHVVAGLGGGARTRSRAAALLRGMEQRCDAEIAEVLRCSESAARVHVGRGLAAGQVTVGSSAIEVPDGLDAPVQVLTRRPEVVTVPRRRGAAWTAALAVVALVGGIALVNRLTSTPAGVISYPSVHAPVGWRTESYGGVQVQVPATWGWGGAPFRADIFQPQHLGGCGSDRAAVASPSDHASYVSSATPFVGRPARLGYQCALWGSDGVVPRTDAVWLGSPVAAGVRSVHGVVAETTVVGGLHVTVFSGRASLRREILGTARVVDVDGNGCPTRPVLQPDSGPASLTPTSLSVCVYSQDSGTTTLEWSGRAAEQGARAYDAAVRAAGGGRSTCPAPPSGQWVALGVRGDGAAVRWDLAVPRCGVIETATGQVPMSEDTVRDWASGGVTAYVGAPPQRSLSGYFQGDLGGSTY